MPRFEVQGNEADGYGWGLEADDGSAASVSGGGYFLKLHCQRGYEMVRTEARDAEIEER